jgi:peptidoglycan hydrolase-like protein with peptidoglycan-binding domain
VRFIKVVLPLLVLALLVPGAGVADAATKRSLGDRTPLRAGHTGEDVRVLQGYLRRAGHRVSVDGSFGRATTRAVRGFQRRQELRATGRMGKRDIRALRDVVRNGGGVRSASHTGGARPNLNARPQAATPPPGAKATVGADGLAVAPADAPEQVKRIIAAGNEIAKMPYRYGGGHGNFKDTGYDCSGSVSYALHGADLLESSMPSGGFTKWGEAGRGQWVTIYANSGHMYMEVAGIRFDTSGRSDRGSRWTTETRSSRGFTIRHVDGL